jgi:hypothetical protein
MPFKVYTTADGTQIHKYEKAPPATAATRKPVLTNTKMSLAEGMFDKTKAVNIKEALKALKAKKAAASDVDYKKDKLKLAAAILSGDDEFISALSRVGYVSDNKNNDETLMKLGEDALEILSKDKPSEYMSNREYVKMYPRTERQRVEAAKQVMKYLSAKIPAEVETENELDKQLQKEVKTGFKDPAKVKAFSDALNIAITEGKEKQMNKNKGIAEIQATITAPKGTKAQLIEMIREMVTDPVDRLKLKMESKSKGDLETLYIKMKAIHDWYKKNRPGEGIDYI